VDALHPISNDVRRHFQKAAKGTSNANVTCALVAILHNVFLKTIKEI
jgi:hypothetical protein